MPGNAIRALVKREKTGLLEPFDYPLEFWRDNYGFVTSLSLAFYFLFEKH